MELRRLSIFIALFIMTYVAQCSEARHAIERRQTSDVNYDELADEASDDEAQNDADGGNDNDEDVEINASIATLPTSYNGSVGATVRLECVVTPDDGVVVQWTKNNVMYFVGTKKSHEIDLSSYNKERCTIAANSTDLVIKDVHTADAGVYRCEILQPDHPAIEHTLNVLEPPKIIRFTASGDGHVVEGADLVLTCEVEGSPPPQIVWSRDSDQGNKRLQEKDGEFSMNSVSIRNVNKQHSGMYYCYAFNGVGYDQKDFKVEVRGKPRVHVHKYVINSAVNVEAVLQCSVHDHLASHIRWYKDGVRIEDSSRQYTVVTSGQNSTLTVTPAAEQDFGTFTCEAENELGKHNRSIELVLSPVVEALDADGPKLSWTVHSHLPLQEMELQLRDISGDGEWQVYPVPLPTGSGHEHEVSFNLLEQQLGAGRYEAGVRARNDHSWSDLTDTAFVDIEAQPQYIQHASVFRGADNEARCLRPASAVVLSTTIMYLLVRML